MISDFTDCVSNQLLDQTSFCLSSRFVIDDCSFWFKSFWLGKLGLVIPLPLLRSGLNFSDLVVSAMVIGLVYCDGLMLCCIGHWFWCQ